MQFGGGEGGLRVNIAPYCAPEDWVFPACVAVVIVAFVEYGVGVEAVAYLVVVIAGEGVAFVIGANVAFVAC